MDDKDKLYTTNDEFVMKLAFSSTDKSRDLNALVAVIALTNHRRVKRVKDSAMFSLYRTEKL